MKVYRVAVDIGGTFTDVVCYDEGVAELKTAKLLSTPDDLSIAVLEGIQRVVPNLADISFFVHGTTAGLNAFLERKGANVALLTTEGFRDVYEIGRANRPDMYNLFYRKPTPLVKRRHILEVPERTLYDGSIERLLDEVALQEAIQRIKTNGYDAVAVVFLHAYANPEHELKAAHAIHATLPDLSVSLSHQVAREWREYERTSTTVLNAYIAPIVEGYVSKLERKVADAGFGENLYIMESNGGVMTSTAAKERPIQTLLSGPVGGAMGVVAVGEQLGEGHLIGIDMGGTSFDVSLVIDGRADVTTETYLEGFPVLMPIVNIHTIGAGGGSIAWVEAGGLRVGPHSAGAAPGPACYGLGGSEPTVTDANLILGRIDPEYFLGGDMDLDIDAATRVLQSVATTLNMGVPALAEGVVAVANAKMANAIRALTVERGIDPREFVMVAFGGAGPMHAVFLAEELQIPKIIVPYSPGTFSAWGMLQTDIRHDIVRTFYQGVTETTVAQLASVFADMESRGAAILTAEGVGADARRFARTADMRYVGQEYFVNIPLPGEVNANMLAALPDRFHQAYHQRYGHSNPEEAIEFVNLRVSAVGSLPKSRPTPDTTTPDALPQRRRTRRVLFKQEEHNTAVYYRSDLLPGHRFSGPAIIEEPSCTTVVPPGYGVTVDGYGNMIIADSEDAVS